MVHSPGRAFRQNSRRRLYFQAAEVLLQTDNAARIIGCFKVILSGADTVKLDIPAENILIMGGAASYRIKMEKKPQDILLRTNATTSEWFDLSER